MPQILATERIPIDGRDSDLRGTLTRFSARTAIELRRFAPDGRPTGSGIAFSPAESPTIRAMLERFEALAEVNDSPDGAGAMAA